MRHPDRNPRGQRPLLEAFQVYQRGRAHTERPAQAGQLLEQGRELAQPVGRAEDGVRVLGRAHGLVPHDLLRKSAHEKLLLHPGWGNLCDVLI